MNCVCRTYDGPEFITESIRTARKEHKCCECYRKILPGQKYEHVRGMWDGHFSTYKTCEFCKKVRDTYYRCGFIYGMLWESMSKDYDFPRELAF